VPSVAGKQSTAPLSGQRIDATNGVCHHLVSRHHLEIWYGIAAPFSSAMHLIRHHLVMPDLLQWIADVAGKQSTAPLNGQRIDATNGVCHHLVSRHHLEMWYGIAAPFSSAMHLIRHHLVMPDLLQWIARSGFNPPIGRRVQETKTRE
jgi:hypothetical protein